jgi:hypothetical protein
MSLKEQIEDRREILPIPESTLILNIVLIKPAPK